MELKEKLKLRRQELGLTLDDVAKAVGVTGATISRWESGDIENMRRDKIALLAKALDVSPAYIMDWEDEKTELTDPKVLLFARHLEDIPEKDREMVLNTLSNTLEMYFGSRGKHKKEE